MLHVAFLSNLMICI